MKNIMLGKIMQCMAIVLNYVIQWIYMLRRYSNMSKFKIGDRVKVKDDFLQHTILRVNLAPSYSNIKLTV